MAYLKKKLLDLEQALNAWDEALNMEKTKIVRDASIQRFEFSFELVWKCLKEYLYEKEGVEVSTPKTVFRETKLPLGLTEEEIELCLNMVQDRNLSTHTYDETLADKIYTALPDYYQISRKIFALLSKKID